MIRQLCFVVGVLSVFHSSVHAQSAKWVVPQKVKAAFEKKHPGLKAKWEKEDGNYEAGFMEAKLKKTVVYDPEGKQLEEEMSISAGQLPQGIKTYISEKKLGRVKEAARITRSDGSVLFEAEINKTDYIFDSRGNYLKQEKA